LAWRLWKFGRPQPLLAGSWLQVARAAVGGALPGAAARERVHKRNQSQGEAGEPGRGRQEEALTPPTPPRHAPLADWPPLPRPQRPPPAPPGACPPRGRAAAAAAEHAWGRAAAAACGSGRAGRRVAASFQRTGPISGEGLGKAGATGTRGRAGVAGRRRPRVAGGLRPARGSARAHLRGSGAASVGRDSVSSRRARLMSSSSPPGPDSPPPTPAQARPGQARRACVCLNYSGGNVAPSVAQDSPWGGP
jgi:hypothetical protein